MSAILLLCSLAAAGLAQTEVVVDLRGSDEAPGTVARPVRTLEAGFARTRFLGVKLLTIRDGDFRLTRGLELDARDSGLTIRAAEGARPTLTGSVAVTAGSMRPCQDQAVLSRIGDLCDPYSLYVVDLAALGVATLDPISPRGFPKPIVPAPSELFADRRPLTLARWPNEGFAQVGKVIEPGNGENDREAPPRKPVFEMPDRIVRWGAAEDPWLFGYWKFDWADESKPAAFDVEKRRATLDAPHVYGVETGARFYAENMLEELDRPGEYWIDRANRRLYLVPPADKVSRYEVSLLAAPILTVKSARSVTVKRLDFAVSRGDGARLADCDDVSFEACRFFALGQRGVVVEGGRRCGLRACDLWDLGEGGVTLSGGDRKTLTPSSHFVVNCDIGNFHRRTQTYRPAALLSGVGQKVAHNAMHDAPHSAIIFTGNDHVIEYNDFQRTIALTGDGGVVYTGRDWTARGTEIRFNRFADNVGISKWEPAVYLDDQACGIRVYGNLIERCHWGFLIGGGRDNVVENNLILDCKLAMHSDARGLGWAARSKPTMMERLLAVPYREQPWASRYPSLVPILEQDPMAPAGNVYRHNVLVRSGKITNDMEEPFGKTVALDGNLEIDQGPKDGRVLARDADRTLRNALPGFQPLPVDRMGLVRDALRKSLPPKPSH
ncbi:MAG: right-handed parallel beta-helix repeat-containing protein [Fimbriimonadaceae bacterium]|nr:right-handed parallel beta-helix repeat-containing protein [Fimbriimonadaceae bacterium]